MATSSINVTAPTSGNAVRVVSNAGVDGASYQQVMTLGGPDGSIAPIDPDGTLQTSPEATSLFLDDFSSALANLWTTGGTAPTTTAGNLVTGESTTASATSYLRSTFPVQLRAGTFLRIAYAVQFEAAATSNNTRWWGLGQYGTPSATVPVVNGALFQLDSSAGALQAVIYSNSVKTVVATPTRATDAAFHRYEIFYRQSIIYWTVDGVTVATVRFPNLAVAQGLYLVTGAANTATAPAAHTFQVSSASAADPSGTNRAISDGLNPNIQASVKSASTAVAVTDLPVAVGLHPSSPLPAGTNVMGSVRIGSITPSTSYYASTTTNAATIAKTTAADLQTLIISNTSASAQFVKIFNAATVTLGTTAAILDIQVATGQTTSLSMGVNGLRLSNAFAYAVTGGLGAANNTAGAGGVLIAATYI